MHLNVDELLAQTPRHEFIVEIVYVAVLVDQLSYRSLCLSAFILSGSHPSETRKSNVYNKMKC